MRNIIPKNKDFCLMFDTLLIVGIMFILGVVVVVSIRGDDRNW